MSCNDYYDNQDDYSDNDCNNSCDPLVIKVDYKNGMKRITFAEYANRGINAFKHLLRNNGVFANNREMNSSWLEYRDEEGDWINLDSDNDLRHALDFFHCMLRVRIVYPQ